MTQSTKPRSRAGAAGSVDEGWRLGFWDTAPMLIDAVAADGRVLACNAAQADALGYRVEDVLGRSVDRFYLRSSAARLRELVELLDPGAVQRHLRLDLRRRDGTPLRVTATIDVVEASGGKVLRVMKMPPDPALDGVEQLIRENETLRSIVSTSRDALWCIEFAEPVDLTAPTAEAVRQVFENMSYWRLCNKAMARLYKLPENLDFNEQHVRVAFPRNPENEAFVEQLIEHDFNIDGAPSLDHRYDGVDVYIENDVRGHIENGMLHRMWGAARDLSEQKRKESDLANRLDATIEVLSAVPDPILVIAQDGVLLAANPAVEWRFGWPIDEVRQGARILLVGESGSGKTEIAKYLRRLTEAPETPFVHVNCGAIPESLFESEMFGYEKGAFTGALQTGKKGLIEAAEGGTLFLDEVGEIPLPCQAKLLKFLEDGMVQRIGARVARRVRTRVISATNRDLWQMCRADRFRRDLFYRLAVIPLEVAPLREQPELVQHLIDHFLMAVNQTRERRLGLSPDRRAALAAYAFPGNIRELHNVLQQLSVAAGDEATAALLPRRMIAPGGAAEPAVVEALPDEAAPVSLLAAPGGPGLLRDRVRAFERELILDAIVRHGSKRKAARALGVDIGTIVRKTQKSGQTDHQRQDHQWEPEDEQGGIT